MYRVMIVDDERLIRMGMQQGISWKSIGVEEVYTAASGREALKIIKEKEPHIMITDINMSEMTGLELIEEVNRLQPDIKILVLTGYDHFEYAHKCLRMQVEDFFLKPIDEEILMAAVKKIIDEFENKKMLIKNKKSAQRTALLLEQLELEKLIRDVVHNRVDLTRIKELEEEYEYNLSGELQVAIIVPVFYGREEGNEQNFLMLSIKNICISLFDAQGTGITFIDDDGKLVLILFEDNQPDDIVERMQKLNNLLKDEYNIRPKVILGNLVKGISNARLSYNEAVYLLKTEKESIHEIIQSYASKNRNQLFCEVFDELKSVMISHTGNLDYILQVFNTFEKAIDSYNVAHTGVKRYCFDLASSLYFAYVSDSGEKVESELSTFLTAILQSERADVCELTRQFIKQLFSKEANNIHEIVVRAKSYISKSLNEEISVASLAEMLYITPNYFSRLFKKATGEGCNEYIVRKRIERAKMLLETTNMKTGKIASMVGYRDINYFSLAFKKHTGMSPTKYRETIRSEEIV